MRFGALGDIHGEFAAMRAVMERQPEVPFWVSVGDVADGDGSYVAPPAPLHWIKGNNEDFELIARLLGGEAAGPGNLHFLPNGVVTRIGRLSVVALGGTFAPTWYGTKAAELPHASRRDDKRRHFVREEVEACKVLRGIDLFLTHEAPRPFILARTPARLRVLPGALPEGRRARGGLDAGKTPINEVLAAMRPRLHLFGHHHRFTESIRQGVPSVSLDVVSRSYLIIDAESLAYEKVET